MNAGPSSIPVELTHNYPFDSSNQLWGKAYGFNLQGGSGIRVLSAVLFSGSQQPYFNWTRRGRKEQKLTASYSKIQGPYWFIYNLSASIWDWGVIRMDL